MGERHNDVVSMARSHDLWRTALAAGWDPEDLEQEVLERVLRRQSMASRYDPRRAGLGKYLWVLTRSILMNLVQMRGSLQVRSEQVGMTVLRQVGPGAPGRGSGEVTSERRTVDAALGVDDLTAWRAAEDDELWPWILE